MVGHTFWLLVIKSQMNPDIIFPSWLLSNSKNLISEVITMYPPLLFYIVNFVNNFTHSLFISTTIIQLVLVIVIDSLLYYYLNKKFGFKLAVCGLFFYIPWQVFFRGNYLWHDFATIPFVILSFFNFEKFVSRPTRKHLLLSAIVLACGYLFKLTVAYVYILYFIWVILITPKKAGALFKNLLILFSPLAIAILVNFLIVLSKSTLAFAFYWNIIMQIFIYPRLPALTRYLSPNYYPIIALLLIIYIVSCYVVWKYSRESNRNKWFLFSFTLVSLLNIFPRWSDFHVQPFLPPLTIVCIYSISIYHNIKHKIYFVVLSLFITTLSLPILGNRIITEAKSAGTPGPDYISKFAPSGQMGLILNKNVFISDYELYDDKLPLESNKKLSLVEQIILGLKNPDYFHHTTSWQKALEYVRSAHPDTVIIPYKIQDKIISGKNRTDFEKYILENYHTVGKIADYFVYTINKQN